MNNLNDDPFEIFRSFFNGISNENGFISHNSEKNEYTVKIKAPGLKKDEIDIEVDYENMKVTAQLELTDERTQYGVKGLKYVVNVKNIDSKSVSPNLKNGILSITFSIDKNALAKKIEIK